MKLCWIPSNRLVSGILLGVHVGVTEAGESQRAFKDNVEGAFRDGRII